MPAETGIESELEAGRDDFRILFGRCEFRLRSSRTALNLGAPSKIQSMNMSAVRTAQSSKTVRPSKARKAATAKKPRFVNTPGPVDDLQSYVKAEWWRHLFNAHYLRTDGDVVDDPAITEREMDAFVDLLQPTPEARILDLCCGQGRHALAFGRRALSMSRVSIAPTT